MKPVAEIQVDLVSNASMTSYPDNNLSSFTNDLIEPIELEGEWEVSVVELFHPTELDPKQVKSVKISLMRDVGGAVKTRSFNFDYKLEDSPETIIKNLNNVFENMNVSMLADPEDSFGAATEEILKLQPISLVMKKDKCELVPGFIKGSGQFNVPMIKYAPIFDDPGFVAALGFDIDHYYKMIKIPANITAKNKPTKPKNPNLLFIYSDIVREHHVGDSMSNCLRAIPLVAGYDKSISTHTFSMPYYFPVRYGIIKNISILLTDETGTPLKFAGGRTFLTLHFRRQLYKAMIN